MYGFKSQYTSINEQFYKLEGCLHSRRKNKLKTFPPFGNEVLPPSKNITLTDYHIIYPMKQNYLYDYGSSGLMFDYIIMYIIRNNKLSHPTEENVCLFTHIENNIIYMYRGHLKIFTGKKGLTSVYKFHVYISIFFK